MDKIMSLLKPQIESTLKEAELFLKTVVDINSYTFNKAGTDKVGKVFRRYFEDLGFKTEVIPKEEVGDILIFSNEAFHQQREGEILFLGHMDTVFPPGKSNIFFHIGDGGYRGNGVTDDKGGIVIAWQAIKSLKNIGLLDSIPIRLFLNTDEEKGSKNSKDIIIEETKNSGLVFVVEYGKPMPSGATVVTSRLGRGSINVSLEGENAEATMLEIMENAYYMATFQDRRLIRVLNFKNDGNYCNVDIAFGYPNEDEGDYLLMALKRFIRQTIELKGNVKGKISGKKIRPPLIFKRKHWEVYDKLKVFAKQINFSIFPEHRVSCSDGSFVLSHIPVLDGIGPIGDYVHTDEEFLAKESLTVRPLLISALMANFKNETKMKE